MCVFIQKNYFVYFRIIGYLCYYGFKACPFFDMMCISEKEIIMNGKPLSKFFLLPYVQFNIYIVAFD